MRWDNSVWINNFLIDIMNGPTLTSSHGRQHSVSPSQQVQQRSLRWVWSKREEPGRLGWWPVVSKPFSSVAKEACGLFLVNFRVIYLFLVFFMTVWAWILSFLRLSIVTCFHFVFLNIILNFVVWQRCQYIWKFISYSIIVTCIHVNASPVDKCGNLM